MLRAFGAIGAATLAVGLLATTAPAGSGRASATAAADCAECHEETHAQWTGSGHSGAFTDPKFQLAGRDGPAGWCLECHAPLRDLGLADEGVGCGACHGTDGPILTARRPTLRARFAHRVRRDEALAGTATCARCHEFPFPVHTPGYPFAWSDEPMQATVSEWAASRSEETCADCHLPLGDHAMPGAHDVAGLAAALAVDVGVDAAGAHARVTLTAAGAAHAVPTGDPFRRFVVELCEDAACAGVLGRARFGTRHERTDTSWRLVEDTRIPPAAPGATSASRTVPVTLDAGPPPSHYRLWYYVAESRLRAEFADEDFRHLVEQGALP